MNQRSKLLLAICSSMFTLVIRGEPVCPPQEDQRSATSESAVVEEILSASHGDYRYRDYIVRWHGHRVAVANPMAISRHAVGDTINLVVSRRSAASDHMLQFLNVERFVPPLGFKAPTTDARESIFDTGRGSVEEVLTADDESFHYVAYIVKWGDSRIAIIDSKALFSAGDSIEFAINGMGTAISRGLYFNLMPTKGQLPTDLIATSKESGIVDAALIAQAEGGYRYRAYLVTWRGARVMLQDHTAAEHVPGDLISFVSERRKEGDGSVVGRMRLDLGEQIENGTARAALSGNISQSTEVATVDEVIEAKVDGIRYVSYLVSWHGERVAVDDYGATTHYAPKDEISFTVTRNSNPAGMFISFNIFKAPQSQSAPSKCDR
jgi:hypothetical protein